VQEAEDLMNRGVRGSGQGFDAKSMGRLGAHGFIPTHNVPEHQRRDAMLKVCAPNQPAVGALRRMDHRLPQSWTDLLVANGKASASWLVLCCSVLPHVDGC
jgi:hypothetical protein